MIDFKVKLNFVKSKSNEKKKYEGLYCEAKDYSSYVMNKKEIIFSLIIGFLIGFVTSYMLFKIKILSLIIGPIFALNFKKSFNAHLYNKRYKKMLLQFRDILESLNTSYSAGKNTMDSFMQAKEDFQFQYGDKEDFYDELLIIINGLNNGYTIESLLENLALRLPLAELVDFVFTFNVIFRKGGNIKTLIGETKDIIAKKIETELQIMSIMHEQKNQLYVLMAMPYGILFMLEIGGIGSSDTSNIVIFCFRFFAGMLFVVSYFLAKRILDVKVR